MNIKKLFRSYRNKLLFEAFIRSILCGTVSGTSVLFLVSIIYHIMIKTPDPVLFWVLSIGAFLIGFVISFFVKYYPNNRKIAQRIDEIGLNERIGTMLEYRDEKTDVATLQRKDALIHLEQTSAKQLRMKITKRSLVTCLACVSLSVCVCLVPYDLFAEKVPISESDLEREQMIKDLIEELREQADQDAFDEDLKKEINDIIDKLEEDLNNSSGELEDGAIIEDAKDKIQEAIDKAVTKDEIGTALQRYELTKKLGEAISEGNTQKVTTALEELECKLTEDNTLIFTLSQNIASALAESGVEAGDELYDALDIFSKELSGISKKAMAGRDVAMEMSTSFDTAEEAINAALEKQEKIEEAGKEIDDTLSDAKDEALGNEEEKEDEAEGEEGEKGEEGSEGEEGSQQPSEEDDQEGGGEQPSGGGGEEGDPVEGEDGDPMGGGPEGDATGEGKDTMTEGIYDPISGNVSYGEVFAIYYAEYLRAVANGTVSVELQAIMDAYFQSLNR